ncbi:MAG: hypothetical protein Q8P80_02840 [Candidatus Levybacteria bacterium]|nr:hypothetical protein [Candidatus Levybacteria bacterium]
MAEINANDKRIKGVIIEAAGDIKQDGIIHTDKDAFIGIRTLGKYESNIGQIIQGELKTERWWEKTWAQLIMLLGAIAGIIGLVIAFS